MKQLQFLLTTSLLFLGWQQTESKNFPIDYPIYQTKNTESIEINRIERNDTATLFFMDAYSSPGNWIRISSGTTLQGNVTGKVYKLIRSNGFNLDEKVTMPDSGNVPFTLQFEQTDEKDTQVDFKEGPSPNDFIITGISLIPRDITGKIHCHLSGKVIDRPQSSRLILIESGKNTRTSNFLSIPIRNGVFEYDLYSDTEEVYELIFWDELLRSAWYTTAFFAEKGPVNFTFYPKENEPRYKIKTKNPLTNEKEAFEAEADRRFSFEDLSAQVDSLYESGKYQSEIYKAFWVKFDSLKDNNDERDKLYKERDELEESGQAYTPEAKIVLDQMDELSKAKETWMLQYIERHPSLATLFALKEMCNPRRSATDLTRQLALFDKVFAKRYPRHPYIKQMQILAESTKLKKGSPYLDISAPDLNGNRIQVSDYTKGKVALIDLWASWCGPCRRNSIRMIPVYEKYKDKGFTIVGIAREKGSADQMKNAIKKDGYPWLNLIELDDAGQIWFKHHIENAAGGTYLIGKDGKILAINPSVEEVEEVLENTL